MAIIAAGTAISRTGDVTHSLNIPNNANVTGVVLRESIPQGTAIQILSRETLTPAGNVTTTGPRAGFVRDGDADGSASFLTEATFDGEDVLSTATLNGTTGTVTFNPPLAGNGARELVLAAGFYAPIGEVKVRPTNVTATITVALGTPAVNQTLILLKNGPKGGFTQGGVIGDGTTSGTVSATVNDVIQAIITA